MQKKRSTGPSRVVPHRSTTPARTCLTSLFGWEAVSQADMAALSTMEEKQYRLTSPSLLRTPWSLWPSLSFGVCNLIKTCPPVPTILPALVLYCFLKVGLQQLLPKGSLLKGTVESVLGGGSVA